MPGCRVHQSVAVLHVLGVEDQEFRLDGKKGNRNYFLSERHGCASLVPNNTNFLNLEGSDGVVAFYMAEGGSELRTLACLLACRLGTSSVPQREWQRCIYGKACS